MKDKQWVVYMLRCADQTLYTGITDDLEHRLSVHGTARGAKYTRNRGPFVLCYRQLCQDHSQALRREYAIKQLTRQQKLQLCKEYEESAEKQ